MATRTSKSVPASFNFFPDDWRGGTYHMTPNQRDIYLQLIMWQWDHGSVPTDENQLVSITQNHSVTDIQLVVRWKFQEEGCCYVNERMRDLRDDAIKRLQTCRENGLKGGRPKKSENNQRVSVQKPIGEGEGEGEVTNKKKSSVAQKNIIPPEREWVEAYANEKGFKEFDVNKFWDHYESNGWKVGRNRMRNWQATVCKANRDGWCKIDEQSSFVIWKQTQEKHQRDHQRQLAAEQSRAEAERIKRESRRGRRSVDDRDADESDRFNQALDQIAKEQ